jgi:hypothetical protein
MRVQHDLTHIRRGAGPRAELVGAEAQRGEHQPERQSDHNVLLFGPVPVAWLSSPLTQARAAAVVQFEERHGYPIIDVLTDALDDIVFDLGPARQPGGNPAHRAGARPGEGANEFSLSRGASCMQHQAIHPQPPPKSADTFRTPADGIVLRPFGPIARIIWPRDTEAFVASVMRRDVRTARRWISGEIDAPAHVWAVMFAIATNPNRSLRQ